jgi:hypothetical protein
VSRKGETYNFETLVIEPLVQALEDFLFLCTAALSERTFLADYNARYSVREDFELFEQAGLRADPTRKHYILDALNVEQQARAARLDSEKEKSKRHGLINGNLDQLGAVALPQQPEIGRQVEERLGPIGASKGHMAVTFTSLKELPLYKIIGQL